MTSAPDGSTESPTAIDSVWTWGLAAFRDRTASDSATPGGGSAAMVSASIGLGLVLMALRVSARKGGDAADALGPLIIAGDRLLVELSDHADADIAAFEGYMAALGLPKATEEEKALRRTAMRDAVIVATEVPLNAAQSALEALDVARRAAPAVSGHIVSDVGAGALLLHAALQATLLNVDINLPSVKDEIAKADYEKSRHHLAAAATARVSDINTVVRQRLA